MCSLRRQVFQQLFVSWQNWNCYKLLALCYELLSEVTCDVQKRQSNSIVGEQRVCVCELRVIVENFCQRLLNSPCCHRRPTTTDLEYQFHRRTNQSHVWRQMQCKTHRPRKSALDITSCWIALYRPMSTVTTHLADWPQMCLVKRSSSVSNFTWTERSVGLDGISGNTHTRVNLCDGSCNVELKADHAGIYMVSTCFSSLSPFSRSGHVDSSVTLSDVGVHALVWLPVIAHLVNNQIKSSCANDDNWSALKCGTCSGNIGCFGLRFFGPMWWLGSLSHRFNMFNDRSNARPVTCSVYEQ